MPPKGRPSKGKRMVDTNVRVTKDTHRRLKTLAELHDTTISEAIDKLILEHAPEVEEAISQVKKIREKMNTRQSEN